MGDKFQDMLEDFKTGTGSVDWDSLIEEVDKTQLTDEELEFLKDWDEDSDDDQ